MSQSSDIEICVRCKKTARKVFHAARIATSNCQFEAHYNWGLGKKVNSKNQIQEELRRIKGETGKEIVEVGNDTLESIKTKRKKYDIDLSEGGYNS